MSLVKHQDHIELPSGGFIIGNLGIFGLCPDANQLFEGYDGYVCEREFLPEDRRHIAEVMIARWKKWGGIE